MEKSTSKNSTPIVVRIAPSPTGNMHIGLARSALFNYLFAKKHGGKFILRIEDTDTARSKPEYEKNITEGLSWLGLTWDEFARQSERTELYRKHLKRIIAEGKAYLSEEEVKKDGDRASVVRFRNPGKKIKFTDLIRGEIEFDTAELGDFVIAKSEDEPLYHFAVVVDDFEMGVTHVIRGEDHISNTPRQILIGEALGAPRPFYAHIPLILAKDRSKLSKRHGAVSLTEYRDKGYLPEAVVNYLALLGWNPGTEQEVFSLDELVAAFDLAKVQKGGAIFEPEKLNWMNRQYLKQETGKIENEIKFHLKDEKLTVTLDKEGYSALVGIACDRISTLAEIGPLVKEGDLSFLKEIEYPTERLLWKGESATAIAEHLEKIDELIDELSDKSFSAEKLKEALMSYAEAKGKGSVLWPLRVALTGKEKSPDPFTVAGVLGKKETKHRLTEALKKLNA